MTLFGFGVIFLSASSLDFVRVKLLRETQVTKLGGSGGVGGGLGISPLSHKIKRYRDHKHSLY